MELYAGIDLHSNNSVVTVLDEQDRTVFAKRLANDLTAIIAALREELAKFDTSKGTIRFQPDRPLPVSMIRKIVQARMAENGVASRVRGGRVPKAASPTRSAGRASKSQEKSKDLVDAFMAALHHPLKSDIEAVRRMLPKNKLATKMLSKLKVYAGENHPHQAQEPEPKDLGSRYKKRVKKTA